VTTSGWRESAGRLLSCAGTGRSVLLASALIVATWLIVISRWTSSRSVVPWDSKNQFYAFFRFLADSLHAGTTVFWNPYHYGGHPSIADPQSLVFSAPFLAWAWFDRAPSLESFDFIVFLHLLVGGLAIAGLGARRDWPVSASWLAAAVFMLGGAVSARLNHTGIVICYGLCPLALLTLEMALQRRSVLLAVAFSLVAANIVLGRNQVALMLCLVLACEVLRQWCQETSRRQWLASRLPLLGVMFILTTVLVAVPLLLTLQLAILSNRPEVTLGAALEGSLHPSNLISLFAANVFGSHAPHFGYWGPNFRTLPEVAATDDSFNYMFIGAIPVFLLLWLGVAGGRLGERGVRIWTVVLVASLLFALGRYTPFYATTFELMPGFRFFRRPVDGVFVMGLVAALLSGHLLADYVRRGLPRIDPLRASILLAGLIALVTSAISIAALSGNGWNALWAMLIAVPVLVFAGLALQLATTPRARRIAAAVLALAATAELVIWNAGSRLNAERRAFYQVLDDASTEDGAALQLLSDEFQRRHREGARPRVEIIGLGGPWQNLSIIRRFEATNGYNPLRIGIYDRFVSPGEATWQAEHRNFPISFDGYDCALARALGLEYLVLDRPLEKLRQLRKPPRVEILMAGPKVWIYRFQGALPRVRYSAFAAVADVVSTTTSGSLRNPPSADYVVIDTETPLRRPHWPVLGPRQKGIARIASWRPGRIEITVEAPAPGVVVLHDIYYPGWTATIDDVPVPVLRADVLFRAVEVSSGPHRVVFKFDPLRWDNLLRAAHLVFGGRAESVEPSIE